MTVGAPRSKISKFPFKVREELNHRLLDNEEPESILAWLNGLPVREKLKIESVTAQNLSDYRNGPHLEWLAEYSRVQRTAALGELSLRLAKAGGGHMGEGAVTVLNGKLLESLEKADEEDIGKIAESLAGLRMTEIATRKVAIDEKKLAQKDRELQLAEQRFRRQTAELFLKWLDDKRAIDIATSKRSHDGKIQALLAYMDEVEK